MRQRYRRLEDQNPGHRLACTGNLDFTKDGGLEPKVKKFSKKVQIGRRAEPTSVAQVLSQLGAT